MNGDNANTTVNSAARANEHVRTPKPTKVTAATKLVENVNGRVVTTATSATSRVVATAATIRPALERDITPYCRGAGHPRLRCTPLRDL